MIKYSINDLEQLTGIKAHTIRIWEKRYNIVCPNRTCTNIRSYTNDDLRKLLSISILNHHGFKISDIAKMTELDIKEKILNLSLNPSDYDTLIESLVIAMIELDETRFEKILSSASFNLGFEETIIEIIYPFFRKIGILWQVGSIVPAQEHFISNLTRQKLIVGIDGLSPPIAQNRKTFILFLHEGELHEIGLLMIHYLLKRRGHRIIYLGQSVPFNDLIKVARIHPPDGLISCFTTGMGTEALVAYLEKLAEAFPKTHRYIAGIQLQQLEEVPKGYHYIRDIRAFKEMIEHS